MATVAVWKMDYGKQSKMAKHNAYGTFISCKSAGHNWRNIWGSMASMWTSVPCLMSCESDNMISGVNWGGPKQKISLHADDIVLFILKPAVSWIYAHFFNKNFTLALGRDYSDFTCCSSLPLSLTGHINASKLERKKSKKKSKILLFSAFRAHMWTRRLCL